MRARVPTPLWVRAALVALTIGGPAWWLAQWRDRVGNEHRLAALASQIAGRPVRVRCPGVIGRLIGWDTVEGSVNFDAEGRPADETKLRPFACAELDALAEGRRADVLSCIDRRHWCGRPEDDIAVAVDVVTHESLHLSGIRDEAQTECRSLETMAWTAEQLGATPQVAQRLAVWEATHAYLRMPEPYHGGCSLSGQGEAAERR
jgi:hypothetical protein